MTAAYQVSLFSKRGHFVGSLAASAIANALQPSYEERSRSMCAGTWALEVWVGGWQRSPLGDLLKRLTVIHRPKAVLD